MYLAIFIFLILVIILGTNININIKSVNDTIKIDAKLGLIRFVIPHHRMIKKIKEKERLKTNKEQISDFKKFLNKRHYLNRLFKHSSLSFFYLSRFTKEEIYLNPILNSVYLITSNQIYYYLSNHFKYVDYSKISLIHDEKYNNIDYYISFKSDLISILTALIKRN